MRRSLIAILVTLALAVPTAFVAAALAAAPSNDDFANSQVVAGNSFSVTGTNVEATDEVGEPSHAGQGPEVSVWYSWTAPVSGKVSIDTCASDFDTVLAVYTGAAVNALTSRGSNDDSDYCPGPQSRVTFNAATGTTYRIAVDGYTGDTGSITLRLLRPANDAFANARTLSGYNASASGSNLNASAEPGEPAHAGRTAQRSVWYRWTAPDSGFASIRTCFSPLDTVLGVYAGSSLASLTPVAASDDASKCGRGSRAEFLADGGVGYRIAVDGSEGREGSFKLLVKKARSGRYRGYSDGKRLRFGITPDGAKVNRFRLGSQLDCGFVTVIFRRIVVGKSMRIRPDGKFSSRTFLRGRGGLLLTVQVTAKLVPPNVVRGHNKVTLRVPGLGRCRSEPSNVSWYARHR